MSTETGLESRALLQIFHIDTGEKRKVSALPFYI
jgi:hypothetical protein